jgi:hypothetical protein
MPPPTGLYSLPGSFVVWFSEAGAPFAIRRSARVVGQGEVSGLGESRALTIFFLLLRKTIQFNAFEHSEIARAPNTNGALDVPRF